jgi:hypothetical protein
MITRVNRLVLLGLMVVAGFAVSAPGASASTLWEPGNGDTVYTSKPVFFDWTWSSSEFTSKILFSKSADPGLANWNSDEVIESEEFVLDSEGPINLNKLLRPGTWYWRTCSVTLTSADDTCTLGAQIWSFELVRDLTRSESRIATRKKIRDRYNPKSIKIRECYAWEISEWACDGYFRKRKKRCEFSADVDGRGSEIRVYVKRVRCYGS